MTREQIIGEVAIGIFLLILGAAAGPFFKWLWALLNRPSPLTPQAKGDLVKQHEMYLLELKRIDHYQSSPKDLFIYMFLLVFFCLFLADNAALLICTRYALSHPSQQPLDLAIFLFLGACDAFLVVGIVEANRLSHKKIANHRAKLQRYADDIQKKLDQHNG